MSDMDYRSWGTTRNCYGCRFWSEMLAEYRGNGLRAMCLCKSSPQAGKYTLRATTCFFWENGYLGAIDQPGGDPYETLAAFGAKESP